MNWAEQFLAALGDSRADFRDPHVATSSHVLLVPLGIAVVTVAVLWWKSR